MPILSPVHVPMAILGEAGPTAQKSRGLDSLRSRADRRRATTAPPILAAVLAVANVTATVYTSLLVISCAAAAPDQVPPDQATQDEVAGGNGQVIDVPTDAMLNDVGPETPPGPETQDDVAEDLTAQPEAANPAPDVPVTPCTPLPVNRVLWTNPRAASVYHRPALLPNGVVVITQHDDDVIAAIKPDGGDLWTFKHEDIDYANGEAWPVASPGGQVYYVDSKGSLHALLSTTGADVWQVLVGGGKIEVFGLGVDASGGVLVGTKNRLLTKLSATGKVEWQFDRNPGTDYVTEYSRPMVDAAGRIYVVDSGLMTVLSSLGVEIWSKRVNKASISLAPALSKTRVFQLVGDLVAFDITSGKVMWTRDFDGYEHEPVLIPAVGVVLYSEGALHLVKEDGSSAISLPTAPLTAPIATGVDSAFIGAGSTVTSIGAGGAVLWSETLAGKVVGLALSQDGTTLYAATTQGLVALSVGANCSPCVRSCQGDEVARCSADTKSKDVIGFCGPPTTCRKGECELVCQPGTVTCDSAGRQKCNADGGGWTLLEACKANDECTLEKCVPCKLYCMAGKVSLTCGSGSVSCAFNYTANGCTDSSACTYENGRSYTCDLDCDGKGTCTGAGATCKL